MSAPAVPASLTEFYTGLSLLRTLAIAQIPAASLIVYDSLLTLDEEVELVWRKPFSWLTLLYLANRYGVPIQACLNLIPAVFAEEAVELISTETSFDWGHFSTWSTLLMVILVESMLVLRVSAMYGHDRRVTIPIVFCFICAAGVMLGFVIIKETSNLDTTNDYATLAGCVAANYASTQQDPLSAFACYFEGNFPWLIFIPDLVLEAILFTLTALRTIKHVHTRRRDTPVISALLNDGLMYFAVIFMIMFANIAVAIEAPVVYQSLMSEIVLCICSTMCARMFLHLRSAAYAGGSPCLKSPKSKSMIKDEEKWEMKCSSLESEVDTNVSLE